MTVRVSDAKKVPQVIVKDAHGNVTKVINVGDLQVGFAGNEASLVLTGGLELETNVVSSANTSVYRMLTEDLVVCVNSPNVASSVILPANVSKGKTYIIKDAAGTASTYPITVKASDGTTTIDGQTSIVIDVGYNSLFLFWNGAEWNRITANGADVNASFMTVNHEASLTKSRQVVAGQGIAFTDGGAGSNITVQTTFNPSASFALVSGSAGDPTQARIITPGTGITITDGGPNDGQLVFSLTAATNPGTALDGLTFLLPRISDASSTTYNCALTNVVSGTLGGTSGSLYYVTLRFRGVVEQKTYTGGDNDNSWWQQGGTAAVDNWNKYSLQISDPPSIYYLNRGTSGQFKIFQFDYTKTIPIAGGAVVTLTADSIEGQEVANNAATSGPLSVSGITSPAQPYVGQFILISFVSASSAQTGQVFVKNKGNLLPSGTYSIINATSGVIAYNDFRAGQNVANIVIDPKVVAVLTGSTFTGAVTINSALTSTGGITGSITKTAGGLSYLVAGSNITIASGTSGDQVVVSANSSAGGTAASGISIDALGNTSINVSAKTGLLFTSGSGTQLNLFNTKTGDDKASYVVTSTTSSLSNATALAAGAGLSLSGATFSANLIASGAIVITSGTGNQLSIFAPATSVATVGEGLNLSNSTASLNIAAGTNITITSGSGNQVVIAATAGAPVAGTGISANGSTISLNVGVSTGLLFSSGSGTQVTAYNTKTGDDRASYIVSATTSSLPNAVLLPAGEGLSVSGATLSLNLAAGTGITFASGSGNQVIINSSGGGGSGGTVWTDSGNTSFTTSSISIDSQGRLPTNLGSDVFFFVSGSQNVSSGPNRHVTVFSGDTVNSGTAFFPSGLTGSLTQLTTGVSYLAGGSNITITTASNGQVVVSTPTVYGITPGTITANWGIVTASNRYDITSGSGFQNVPGASLTLTSTGGPILVMVQASWCAITSLAQSGFNLTRNSTIVSPGTGDPAFGMMTVGPRVASYNAPVNFAFLDTSPAGTYTYQLTANGLAGTGSLAAFGVGPTTLMAFEMKNLNFATSSTTSATTTPASIGAITGLSASIIPSKNPVVVLAMVNTQYTNANDWTWYSIFRGATNLAPLGNGLQISECGAANEIMPGVLCVVDTSPTFGATNTYTVETAIGSATTPSVNKKNQFMTVIAFELTDVNWKYGSMTTSTALGSSFADPTGFSTNATSISTRGRPVFVLSNANYNPTTTLARGAYSIGRNGSTLITASLGMQLVDGSGVSGNNQIATVFWIDNPSASTNTYGLFAKNLSGSGGISEGSMQTNVLMYEIDIGYQQGATFAGWLDEGNALVTTASVSLDTALRAPKQIGSDINLWVSGSISVTSPTNASRHVATFGGDVVVSGTVGLSRGLVTANGTTPVAVSIPQIFSSHVPLLVRTVNNGNTGSMPSINIIGGTGFWITGSGGDTSTYSYVVI